MSINVDVVRSMARLARLAIDDDDVPQITEQLSGILAFVDQLQAADTAGVEPLAHPAEIPARLRKDEVTETDERDRLQQGAPRAEDGLFLVPRVIE